MSQFRITYTSIIYGALVHRSCSSWFPYNAKHTPLCLTAGGKSTEPKVACWSRHLPSSLTCPTSESSDTSWCVRVHGHASPPPSHICALCRNHVCPRGLEARGERWSGRSIQETEQTEIKDAFKRVGQPWAGLQHNRPSEMRAATTSPLSTRAQWGDWGPRTAKNTPQTWVPKRILAYDRADSIFWQERLLFGENEPTALMDNAGEGTHGTGLWERKF